MASMPIYLGTTPVALKLGTLDVSGFLGNLQVTAALPPPPGVLFAVWNGDATQVAIIQAAGITDYIFYIDGAPTVPDEFAPVNEDPGLSPRLAVFTANLTGAEVRVASVGEAGEGVKSAPATVTDIT